MQQHAALGLLVAISCLLIAHHDGAAVAAALPACQVNTADTSVVSENCLLSSPLLASASGIVRLVGGVLQPQLPLVVVSSSSKATAGTGSLELTRLVLAGAKLTPPAGDAPPLWPLGVTDTVGSRLNISDVRLIVDAADLQSYVTHLQSLPRAVAQYHTDGKTFVHIAAWLGPKTLAHSVTLISGGCLAAATASSGGGAAADATAFANFSGALAAAAQDGCNVRSVDNSSLINPTLLKYGSLPTPQPLLVLITSNVSLGWGLNPGAIPVHRPVVLVGLFSVPTSVDMHMVVNQLNATSKHAKLFFQSLFIENAAPGDAISSLLSRPMSSAVSANVYAVYCDRMTTCLNLHNSTIVLASANELDYVNFQYSMFNSPLPNMRANVQYYKTELRCVVIDFAPGPNGVGMLLHNLTCGAWDVYESVFTTEPKVAERLPMPEGAPQIAAVTQAGPLVQSVRDCDDLQTSMQFETVKTRQHVWMLLNSIDLQPESNPKCWVNRTVNYPTQIYGRAQAQPGSAASHELSLGFLRPAFQLPADAPARFFSVYNTSVRELPQGPDPRQAFTPGRWPPDIFTLLLWPVGRSTGEADPVFLQDVTFFVPQPEFDFFADRAAASSSFVVQLMGSDDLTFRGTAAEAPGSVRMQLVDGPGLQAAGLELRPVPAGQPLPPDYYWPAAASEPLPSSQRSGLTGGQVAGVVIGSIAGLLLLVGVAFAVVRSRQRHSQYMLPPQKQLPPGVFLPSPSTDSADGRPYPGKDVSQHSGSKAVAGSLGSAGAVALDISPPADALTPLPAVSASFDGRPSPCAAPAAASASNSIGGSAVGAASLPSAAPSSSAAMSSSSLSDSLSLGLDRWKAAISTTTMQLMERRMQLVHGPATSSTGSMRTASGGSRPSRAQAGGPGAASRGQGRLQQGSTPPSQQQSGLQIHHMIGKGSFGSVWEGLWHQKTVAIKIMSLPASGPFPGPEECEPAALMAQNKANSAPMMAIMEATLSSTVSHPNVIQVFTYFLTPLGLGSDTSEAVEPAGPNSRQSRGAGNKITGWELKIVMEMANGGTLREALDRRTLHAPGAKYLSRETILSLTHDIAAALLHLHSQGVVHGDLKAANVMLTQCGEGQGGVYASGFGHKIIAKVADFGLALPLDPADTHATMAARGTPTHMSPEIYMSGHVSKASDIYAFGILLCEMLTGSRAYQGVPVPLLPHEVVVKGLRPSWPGDIPDSHLDLQCLAQACWAQSPQDRPTITDIFDVVGRMVQGKPVLHLLPQLASHQQQQQQQSSQQSPAEGSSQPPPPQQQPQQGDAQQTGTQQPPATAAADAAGRKKNMSWSEVSFTKPA